LIGDFCAPGTSDYEGTILDERLAVDQSQVGGCPHKIPELQRYQESVGFDPHQQGGTIQEYGMSNVHDNCHEARKSDQQQLKS
jgi:hypothetical protein